MSRRYFKSAVSLLIAVVMTITCCISAYADVVGSGVWQYGEVPSTEHEYRCQYEYYPSSNFAQNIVRSQMTDNYMMPVNHMYVLASFVSVPGYNLVASTGCMYNAVATNSMSFQVSVTNAGLYKCSATAGYYDHTDGNGSVWYHGHWLDGETHYFVPGYNNAYHNEQEMQYDRTVNGETYGAIKPTTNQIDYPDLIRTQGDNGTIGYVRRADLFNEGFTDAEITAYMKAVEAGETISIPVYDLDGEEIDIFTLSTQGEIIYS